MKLNFNFFVLQFCGSTKLENNKIVAQGKSENKKRKLMQFF